MQVVYLPVDLCGSDSVAVETVVFFVLMVDFSIDKGTHNSDAVTSSSCPNLAPFFGKRKDDSRIAVMSTCQSLDVVIDIAHLLLDKY